MPLPHPVPGHRYSYLIAYGMLPPGLVASIGGAGRRPSWASGGADRMIGCALPPDVVVVGNKNDAVLGPDRHRDKLTCTQPARRLDSAQLNAVDGDDIFLFKAEK